MKIIEKCEEVFYRDYKDLKKGDILKFKKVKEFYEFEKHVNDKQDDIINVLKKELYYDFGSFLVHYKALKELFEITEVAPQNKSMLIIYKRT